MTVAYTKKFFELQHLLFVQHLNFHSFIAFEKFAAKKIKQKQCSIVTVSNGIF